MTQKTLRIPITNVLAGGDYTGTLLVGSQRKPVNVLLDTGSSTLAVHQQAYDPTKDAQAKATNIAQEVQYGSGAWLGAVVRTSMTVGANGGVTLSDVALAVATQESAHMFSGFDGILGLAYEPLDDAFAMPNATWPMTLTAREIAEGQPTFVEPYFSQLEERGIVANKFAFYTLRSFTSLAESDPRTDPLNAGWLILGGGEEATDLHTGSFKSVRVVSDAWYNINLKSIQIDGVKPIHVRPATKGSQLRSNAILDSGTNSLTLDRKLYAHILTAFHSLNPEFALAIDQTQVPVNSLDLKKWPDMTFVLEGTDGDVPLVVRPDTYWQLHAGRRGDAVAPIFSDNGTLRGQSILGLPLMNNYFTVHDRTANGGIGVIKFAPIVRPSS